MNDESLLVPEPDDGDAQLLPLDADSASALPADEVPAVRCWRCAKDYAGDLASCPWCRAANRTVLAVADARKPAATAKAAESSIEDQVVLLVWFFTAMLITSLLAGLSAALAAEAGRDRSERAVLTTLGAEVIDSIILVIALAKLPWPGRPAPSRRSAWAAWLLALPVLAGMLALNFGYHHLLLEFLQMPRWAIDAAKDDLPTGWAILLVCIQPGIVEEAFFRFLSIGTLRRVVRPSSAIWISAVMFGMAHIGAPLSIPYLILLGLVLGKLYCASGSLVLPVLLHMLHNAVVVFGESLG